MTRRRRVLHLSLISALLLAVSAPIAAAPSAPVRLPAGLVDPESGGSVTLEAGSPALHVVFFATWCPPCVEELPRLVELENRWKGRGYRLVLVAVATRQKAERLGAFKKEREVPGQLLFDVDGRLEREWQAAQLPTHLLLNAEGHEVLRKGALDAEFEAAVERSLVRRGAARP
jgi:thiol-disulfide isomerase/thioredoxin